MSDIGIRFDGLLLAMVLAATAAIFAVVGSVALILGRGRLAKGSAGLTGIGIACFGLLALTIDAPLVSSKPYDWLDWLVAPWLALVVWAVARLVRAARA